MKYTVSIEIALLRERVVGLLADPAQMPKWLRGLVVHEPLSGTHGEDRPAIGRGDLVVEPSHLLIPVDEAHEQNAGGGSSRRNSTSTPNKLGSSTRQGTEHWRRWVSSVGALVVAGRGST
jgi:hypothetical protein